MTTDRRALLILAAVACALTACANDMRLITDEVDVDSGIVDVADGATPCAPGERICEQGDLLRCADDGSGWDWLRPCDDDAGGDDTDVDDLDAGVPQPDASQPDVTDTGSSDADATRDVEADLHDASIDAEIDIVEDALPDTDGDDVSDDADADDDATTPEGPTRRGADEDGDGWGALWGDCDDANPAVNPGAAEVLNGVDDDCDGVIDNVRGGGGACSVRLATSSRLGVDYAAASAFQMPIDADPADVCPPDWWICVDYQDGASCVADCAGIANHLGEDWNHGSGSADVGREVVAPANGVVTWVHESASWVRVVVVRHDAPAGQAFVWWDRDEERRATTVWSLVAHIDFARDWSVGDAVAAGEALGTISGTLCTACTGPHLHWEMVTTCDAIVPGPGYAIASGDRTDPSDFVSTVTLVDDGTSCTPTSSTRACLGRDIVERDDCGDTRTVTTCDYACADAACVPRPECEHDVDCPADEVGSWSSCAGYADACDESGTRSREVTSWSCTAGACRATTSTESDSGGCTRDTDGDVVDTGAWGTCSAFSSGCDESGSQSRTERVCRGGFEQSESTSRSCSRDTDGDPCSGGTCSGGSCEVAPSEVCNGVDDDGDGVIDELDTCWQPVYRFWNTANPLDSRMRCYGNSTTPPAPCAGFALEISGPVFWTYRSRQPGTVALHSHVYRDVTNILTEGHRGDLLDILNAGDYVYVGVLGYVGDERLGAPTGTYHRPSGATTSRVRELRRYSHPAFGRHLYANNPEETAPGWSFEGVRAWVYGSRW